MTPPPRDSLFHTGLWSDLQLCILPHGWIFHVHRAIVAPLSRMLWTALASPQWASSSSSSGGSGGGTLPQLTLTLPDLYPTDGPAWQYADMQQFLSLVYDGKDAGPPPPPPSHDEALRAWLRVHALARYFDTESVARSVEQWLVGAWPDTLVATDNVPAAVGYAKSLSAMLSAPERTDMYIQLVAWMRSALASCLAAVAAQEQQQQPPSSHDAFLALEELPRMACERCCTADPVLPTAAGRVLLRRRRHSGGSGSGNGGGDMLTIGCATAIDYATLDRHGGYAQYSLAAPRPYMSVALEDETPALPHCYYTGICPQCHSRRPLVIHWIRATAT